MFKPPCLVPGRHTQSATIIRKCIAYLINFTFIIISYIIIYYNYKHKDIGMQPKETCIYIHIPFCKSKCYYCSFYSIPTLKLNDNIFKDYTDLLTQEIEIITKRFALSASHVDSIYFGGGTPSIMPIQFFKNLLEAINNNFCITKNTEITAEINPESGSMNKLSELKQIGINRLSIGAQSFNDKILKTAGRIHNKKDIFTAVNNAKKVGFSNISLDLIIGLPGQTEVIFCDDVKQMLTMEPKHISAYMLSIEKETKFYKARNEKNRTVFISEEKIATHYEKLCKLLDENNYIHYEISNFSKNGYESKHNLNYWHRGEYIGIGPSAASFLKLKNMREIRKTNPPDLDAYRINVLNESIGSNSTEILTEKEKINEEIFLSLRTRGGIKLNRLLEFVEPNIIENLIKAGLMYMQDIKHTRRLNKNIALTVKGMLLSSEIFARIML